MSIHALGNPTPWSFASLPDGSVVAVHPDGFPLKLNADGTISDLTLSPVEPDTWIVKEWKDMHRERERFAQDSRGSE